jgi:uncharacterized Zn finger protein
MSWGRRKRKSRYDDYWPSYVPVSDRRAKAEREVAKLRKKGEVVHPVEIEGRTIARSFWGKGWCAHLESFGDYSNRLPRGRTYARNGSICHLAISKGAIEAIVSGSELYRVRVEIAPLKKKKWIGLKKKCTGKIGSLIELLQGNLSDEIMSTVTDREHGLFPLPGEIKYTCNCPDWADMCKHISAVMYGIGARLDSQPELLFLLRGLNHEELITADATVDAIAGSGSRRARRRSLSDKDLENVFGVELDAPKADAKQRAGPTRRQQGRRNTPAKKSTVKKKSFKPSARSVVKLRQRLAMSKADFAQAVGVSPATVANWENATGRIKPQANGLAGLKRLHEGNNEV